MTFIRTVADLTAVLTDVDPLTKICIEVTGDEGDPQSASITDVDVSPHWISLAVAVDTWPITNLTSELLDLVQEMAGRKSKDRACRLAREILIRHDLDMASDPWSPKALRGQETP
jgi:hypothetical protein